MKKFSIFILLFNSAIASATSEKVTQTKHQPNHYSLGKLSHRRLLYLNQNTVDMHRLIALKFGMLNMGKVRLLFYCMVGLLIQTTEEN
ncbi:MAG TPA: hypothetical protein VHD33_05605 [Legionellaceae bacterium]|nr:hypothetical protein [Legionellaceae bacterium]